MGTDGKIALLATVFKFPFSDDILVAALPVFGSMPLRSKEVRVGCTSTHLVNAAGTWSVWLPLDCMARYPDVLALILGDRPPSRILTTTMLWNC